VNALAPSVVAIDRRERALLKVAWRDAVFMEDFAFGEDGLRRPRFVAGEAYATVLEPLPKR
jgi:hypothetical protein